MTDVTGDGGARESRALADALWDGVRHRPPIATSDHGLRGWYLRGPYAWVVRRRRTLLWRHRSGEPWLTAQWLLDRAGGSTQARSALRYEGFPGRSPYEPAYQRIVDGRFDVPFVYVAGYSRSGTTSVQNLALAAFAAHVPEGRWDGPGHPLRIWWYPKHDPAVAARIAALAPTARVLACVRPFVDAATSLALYTGRLDPADVQPEWVREQARTWLALARTAAQPQVLTVAFDRIAATNPATLADWVADGLGIEVGAGFDREAAWAELYQGRISPEELDNPYLANLPHIQRPELVGRLSARIADLVAPDRPHLDEAYAAAVKG